MCPEPQELWAEGADAAEAILREAFLLDVAKALDPLDKGDFLSIVQRLAHALRGVARPAEEAALRRALERLDVDWPHLTPTARDQVIRAARQSLRDVERQVLPRVAQVFEVEADRVVERTRRATIRRFGLSIAADMTKTDERIARFARESQGNFVRDEYGRRRDEFSRRARDIVSAGAERGLGRDDIVAELSSALASDGFNRSRDYWEVVSMVFANRARTFTQVAAFDEAGVERYRFEAILDQATSEVCRFLHGKVFTVASAMDRFQRAERARDPEVIRDVQPFVQVGADEDGSEVLFYERSGRRRAVAQVDEPAVGARDEVGRYSRALSTAQLEAAGISVPPLHGRCRSTIVAEV
jgi:SPP1 gp7 family putative phage head morphogenesis protein